MSARDLGRQLGAEIGLELDILACRGLGVRYLFVRRAWLDALGLARVLELVETRGEGELVAVLGASWQDPGVQPHE